MCVILIIKFYTKRCKDLVDDASDVARIRLPLLLVTFHLREIQLWKDFCYNYIIVNTLFYGK